MVPGCQYTHHWLLDRVFSSYSHLACGVLKCDIFHRRSVGVLCMLNKFRSDPIHSFCGELHLTLDQCGLHVVTYQYSYVPRLCRTSQYHQTLISYSVSLCIQWCIMYHSVYSMVWEWWVLKAGPMPSCWPELLSPFLSPRFFLPFFYGLAL